VISGEVLGLMRRSRIARLPFLRMMTPRRAYA